MELVEHTANHLGIISKGSLEIFANQVRLDTIKEVEEKLLNPVNHANYCPCNHWQGDNFNFEICECGEGNVQLDKHKIRDLLNKL